MMTPGYGKAFADLFGLPFVPMTAEEIMDCMAQRIAKAKSVLGL